MSDLDITAELPAVEPMRYLVDSDPERVYVTRCPETSTDRRSQDERPNNDYPSP